jgi:hypothetical protein
MQDAQHSEVAVAAEHDQSIVAADGGDDAAVSMQASDTTTSETTDIAGPESSGKFEFPLSCFFFLAVSPPRLASLDAPTRASIARCTCPHGAG